jgi:corrinoid protein of di/trimethylamine methyltransferase
MVNLRSIYEAVLAGKFNDAVENVKQALAAGADPQQVINEGLIPAMEEIGKRFEAGQAFVPQMLLSARAMKSSLEVIKPLLGAGAGSSAGKVVIGTVKGDLHDIGKNLVASMLEGVGFEVIDLGIDVPTEKFIDSLRENKAQILCMSALLTTTMTMMEVVIRALEEAGMRQGVKVMVGGAPVTENFAARIGADGYSDNANAAAKLAKRLIA